MQEFDAEDDWKIVMGRIKSHISHSRAQFNMLQKELTHTMIENREAEQEFRSTLFIKIHFEGDFFGKG